MTIRILYVDDEADIREVACLALGLDPELETRSCASGAEAVRIVPEWRPDLVVLDVMMPEMDGLETFRRIREQPGPPPVAFITARSQASEVERLQALGAAGVVAKPFDPMSLAATARKLLGR